MKKAGRPKRPITLSEKDQIELRILTTSVEANSRLKLRAEIVLLSAGGMSNIEIVRKLGTTKKTVTRWRNRYLSCGIAGLHDEPRPGCSCKTVEIDEGDMEILKEWSKSRSLPHSLVTRANIIIFAAEGKSNIDIAAQLNIHPATVSKWRRHYRNDGLEGLNDGYRPGRRRSYSEEKIATLLNKTLETKPEGATHWSCRTMSEEVGISRSTVNRIWNLFCIKPHKRKNFKISTDPFFVDKVVDVCGLYLNPPDNALILCVDEKSQCQALERTQPILPMGLGYAEGVTDNYYRHGTITLFAALDVATGSVDVACKKRHRHQEFIAFLNQIKRNVPKELDVHIILDNYSTHKHEKVKAWIARNPRFHFHFTPTYSSWLNMVERWFGIITDKAIRRGSFVSTKQLIDKIELFSEVYNRNPKPFVWTAKPEEILEKVGRLCEKITEPNSDVINESNL